MIRVINLVDDTNVGGVMRGISTTAGHFSADIQVEIRQVKTVWSLPPRLAADIVLIDFTMSWAKLLFLFMLRLNFRGPLVVVEHSYTESYEANMVEHRSRFRLMLRLSYWLIDRVVAVSNGQGRWIKDVGLVKDHKLTTIVQSLDVSALAHVADIEISHSPMHLGAYGRFTQQKGFDILIEAMRLVPPHVATLTIAGYGPDEAALRLQAKDIENVMFRGKFSSPDRILSDVEAVVVPSRWEAYGLVAIEARAAGRPVIASAVDGLIEQIHQDWGLLVPHDDPISLAAAIIELAKKDRATMGRAARRSAAGSLARKVSEWEELYRAMAPQADAMVAGAA